MVVSAPSPGFRPIITGATPIIPTRKYQCQELEHDLPYRILIENLETTSNVRAPSSIHFRLMVNAKCDLIRSAAFSPAAFSGCIVRIATKVEPWPSHVTGPAYTPAVRVYIRSMQQPGQPIPRCYLRRHDSGCPVCPYRYVLSLRLPADQCFLGGVSLQRSSLGLPVGTGAPELHQRIEC